MKMRSVLSHSPGRMLSSMLWSAAPVVRYDDIATNRYIANNIISSPKRKSVLSLFRKLENPSASLTLAGLRSAFFFAILFSLYFITHWFILCRKSLRNRIIMTKLVEKTRKAP